MFCDDRREQLLNNLQLSFNAFGENPYLFISEITGAKVNTNYFRAWAGGSFGEYLFSLESRTVIPLSSSLIKILVCLHHLSPLINQNRTSISPVQTPKTMANTRYRLNAYQPSFKNSIGYLIFPENFWRLTSSKKIHQKTPPAWFTKKSDPPFSSTVDHPPQWAPVRQMFRERNWRLIVSQIIPCIRRTPYLNIPEFPL